jgi:hypothetical protein
MARKPVADSAPVAEETFPDISFTEAEVQQVADFINFVYKNGEFKMTMADTKKVQVMLGQMHAHVTKIEKYIFEHRRILASKKKAE